MIEIKNLTKIYVPKKGVPVVALNNVNLKIEDKGLVFILGKSGSGKSTLLNLLGGLDKYNEGDIIIKGKSTKDFTQADFDSYRNTYVGFIFQEYNILDDFSVGANIALAIELQGRKASNQEVNRILDTLDLTGFGNRRPNELSGGQKQRVAIARALVKNPDIILADEPTGSLDSKTGLQIFEILKKLSKEKLVLVVSHDREFAETYGDRVIELADGKIISDISKKTVTTDEKDSPNIRFAEKEGLVVREGYKLTEKDLEMINRYLEQMKNLNIVSKSESEFKTQRVFVKTEEIGLKSYSGHFKMIKSRLPFKMAFRMGASGLNHKKFRLFFTILLSFIAFTLFGVADSLAAYNKIDATVNSIIDGNIESAVYSKAKTIETDRYTQTINQTLSEEDVEKLNDGIGKEVGLTFKPVYSGGIGYYEGAFRMSSNYSPTTSKDYNMYYMDSISGFAEFTKEELEGLDFDVYGELPDADDEIAITDYIFEHFQVRGYGHFDIDTGQITDIKPEEINDYNKLFGRTITLYNYYTQEEMNFKITGVVDTKLVSDRYEPLKKPYENIINYYLGEEFRTVIQYGYHSLGFVNSGLIEKLAQEDSGSKINVRNSLPLDYYDWEKGFGFTADFVDKLDSYENDRIIFFNPEKTTLAADEILVDFHRFRWSYYGEFSYEDMTGNLNYFFYEFLQKHILEYARDNYAEAEANGFYDDRGGGYGLTTDDKIDIYFNYLRYENGYYLNEYGSKNGADFEIDAAQSLKPLLNQIADIQVQKSYYNPYIYESKDAKAKIVGVVLTPESESSELIIVDDEFYSELESIARQNPYSFAIAKMPDERSKIRRLVEFSYRTEDDISYPMKNSATPMLEMANNLVENVAKVFFYIGIAFAVFSALMLSNFIGSSVALKKREIGILRAIGARSSDVFRIFFNESIIIALINFFLAAVATFIAVEMINNSLRSDVGLTVTIFNYTVRQVLLILLISVFVAMVASFLPVNRIARKKPVDAIHNK